MSHELLHTSAVRGLHMGTDGYCTVAETPGIPKPLGTQLERLSGYRHRVKKKTPDLVNNPIAFSHVVLTASGVRYHILSRVADAGFDHTERTNYLAHHIALGSNELPRADPAWLCMQRNVFQTDWPSTRKPKQLTPDRDLPRGDSPTRKCVLWERQVGDAGWAGVLAGTHSSRDPVYILYRPGQQVLEFLSEALALLPPNLRWRVTFNTYFTDSGGLDCQWRCVLNDSHEAETALATRNRLIFRLDKHMVGEPVGELVTVARTGVPLTPEPNPGTESKLRGRESEFARTPRRRPIPEDNEPADGANESTNSISESRVMESVPVRQVGDARGSPVKPLILGVVLGLALALVATVLLELAVGKSLLRQFGVLSEPEKQLGAEFTKFKEDSKDEKDKLDRELTMEKARLKSIEEELRNEKKAHTQSSAVWKTEKDNLTANLFAVNAWLSTAEGELRKAKDALANKPPDVSGKPTASLAGQPGTFAMPLSLVPGPNHLLPPGEAAALEFIAPPLGTKIDTEDKLSILATIGGNEIKVMRFTYDKAKGTLNLWPEKPSLPPGCWAGAVLKVMTNIDSVRYYQLGTPLIIHWPKDGSKSSLNVLPNLKPLEKNTKVGFKGDAVVRVNGKEYTLGLPLFQSPPENFPSTLSYLGKEDKLTIGMKIEDGVVSVSVKGNDPQPAQPMKVNVIWAEIVPAKRVEGLSVPPVVVRIQEP